MAAMTRTSIIIGGLLAGTSAHAQPQAEPARAESPNPSTSPAGSQHRFTIMWAPIRLVVPLAEMTAEYAVKDKLGVSVTLGGGKRTVVSNNMELTGTEIEGGAQVRYYALGDFSHGMELGGEVLYEHVKFSEPLPAGIVGVAAGGLTVGPFVGYKVATNLGFTFEGQIGARYLASPPPVTGMGTFTTDKKWLPLLHLNIGWSF